jgi:hypothetical protein
MFSCHGMTSEQHAAVDWVANKLDDGEHKRTFEALAKKAWSQKALADQLKATSYDAIGHRILELRSKLEKFYGDEEAGTLNSPLWRVYIPQRRYCLAFEPNSSFYVRRFWGPHIQDTSRRKTTYPTTIPTRISFTELRFFRSNNRRFFLRHQDINDDAINPAAALQRELPDIASYVTTEAIGGPRLAEDIQESHFFTTSGEMSCVLMLTIMFGRHRVDSPYTPQHKMPSLADLSSDDENILLIGNKRTHPLIREIQKHGIHSKDFRWTIENLGIKDRGSPEHFVDLIPVADKEERLVYAVLSRMPSPRTGRAITVLAANHGRAFEGVGELITSDEFLQTLLKDDLNWPDEEPLPERFQILFSVEVDHRDEKVQTGATFIDAVCKLGLAAKPKGPSRE